MRPMTPRRALLGLWALLSLSWFAPVLSLVTNDPFAVSNNTYDYVIVGGGTAGLAVARRLSAKKAITVLVIEAGADARNDPRVYDPYNAGAVYYSDLDWAYPTDQGRIIDAGKALGGSSSINGMWWTRGSKAQYDAWSTLLDPEDQALNWNWQSMFSYMKKAETFTPPTAAQRAKGATSIALNHGYSGPVQAGYAKLMYGGPQQPAFVNTMARLGISKGEDLNGGYPNVVSFTPNSINTHTPNDTRSSSATAYLSPVENITENWTTLVGQQVTKVLFSPNSSIPRVAVGVRFGVNTSLEFVAYARREVILSAGAIGSPAVLQLSGIGDPALLAPLGVEPVVNLSSVGLNLQEQTLTLMTATGTDFDVGGKGGGAPIAYPNIFQLFGANATGVIQHIKDSIPAWAASQASSAYSSSALEKIYTLQSSLIVDNKAPIAELISMTGSDPSTKLEVVTWQLLPFSRGNVSITSTDPFTKPRVNVNYFALDIDLDIQIAATRLIRRAFQTPPLSNLSLGETSPGFSAVPDDVNHGSKADWTSWVMANYYANSHPIATCSMMSRSLGGVVDGHLRVYDTANLRVVDASIMPLQISAHLSSTVYGIGEKAADLILQDLTGF